MFFRGQIERRAAPSAASLLGYSDRPIVVAVNTEAIHIINTDSPSVSYGMNTYIAISTYTAICHFISQKMKATCKQK